MRVFCARVANQLHVNDSVAAAKLFLGLCQKKLFLEIPSKTIETEVFLLSFPYFLTSWRSRTSVCREFQESREKHLCTILKRFGAKSNIQIKHSHFDSHRIYSGERKAIKIII